jgi:hypothetical protein
MLGNLDKELEKLLVKLKFGAVGLNTKKIKIYSLYNQMKFDNLLKIL